MPTADVSVSGTGVEALVSSAVHLSSTARSNEPAEQAATIAEPLRTGVQCGPVQCAVSNSVIGDEALDSSAAHLPFAIADVTRAKSAHDDGPVSFDISTPKSQAAILGPDDGPADIDRCALFLIWWSYHVQPKCPSDPPKRMSESPVALSLEKLLCCEVCSRPLGPDDPPLLWPESYPMCLECTIEMEEDLYEEACLTAA